MITPVRANRADDMRGEPWISSTSAFSSCLWKQLGMNRLFLRTRLVCCVLHKRPCCVDGKKRRRRSVTRAVRYDQFVKESKRLKEAWRKLRACFMAYFLHTSGQVVATCARSRDGHGKVLLPFRLDETSLPRRSGLWAPQKWGTWPKRDSDLRKVLRPTCSGCTSTSTCSSPVGFREYHADRRFSGAT